MENNTTEDDARLSVWLLPQKKEAEVDISENKDGGIDVGEHSSDNSGNDSDDENEEEFPQQSKLAHFGWVVLAIAIFMCFLLPLSFVSLLLRTIPLHLSDWAQVWPMSTFFIWFLTCAAGFAFVARITEKRENPFKCRSGTYTHFVRLLISTPLVYLMGPIRVMNFLHRASIIALSPPSGGKLHSFTANFVFLLAFFIGIQFTYLDYIMLFRTAGDKFGSPSLWKTYTKKELSLIIPIVLGIVSLVGWHFYLINSAGLWAWYGGFYFIVLLAIGIPTFVLRKTHYLHFHHYAIFGLLIPFFAFPNTISSIAEGVVCGVMVEGVARWGMVGMWGRGTERSYEFSSD